VAVGRIALDANTTGNNNTALGDAALTDNTTGSYNVGVGRQALTSNTTASNNVAVGYLALQANTTASNNTAVGYQAGYSQTTPAGGNTYIGYLVGYGVTTGEGNVFVGGTNSAGSNPAGYAVTTGSRNNFFGQGAGGLMTTGSKNTIIGNYNGNQGGLDIRTSSNNIVLSDGDGNPTFWIRGNDSVIISPAFNASRGMGTTDMNTVRASGMYRFDNFTPNAPTTTFYSVVVYGNADNVVSQLATVFQGSTTYTRSYNTSWSAWVQL